MRALVVYESMYGNTHLIADAIGDGLRTSGDVKVTVVPIHEAGAPLAADADLLVVGGPTHAHGLSRVNTRKAAFEAVKAGSDLTVEADAEGEGVRGWLDSLGDLGRRAAAFDTRMDGPAALTGRASKGIAHKLRDHGCSLIADPESFLVTKETHLEPDEESHARRWGATLAAQLASSASEAH